MDTRQVFLNAVQAGDVRAVTRGLDADPDLLYSRTDQGVTALLLAVYYRQREVLAALLARHPETSIFEASALGQTERVIELLDADPRLLEAFSDDGFMPLGLAAFFGHPEMVAALLRAGANPDLQARNAMQVRPLHSAVANDDPQIAFEIARLLLDGGAEVNVAQQGGWTPLHGAAHQGHAEVVRLLLQHGADKNATSGDGKSPQQMASEAGHAAASELLR